MKKKKIIFALPGDNFSSKFLISWTEMIHTLFELQKYEITIMPSIGSFIPFVRMKTLGLDTLRGDKQKVFNGENFDIWITIDSDIIFTSDQIIELIESTEEHPVVAGMYRMSDLTNYAFVRDWNVEYFKKHGSFQFSTPDEIKKLNQKYISVSYSGMGFMAIRKEVFDKMKYPYFHSELQKIECDNGKILRDICSEDVAFCQNITKAGYKIVVNTNLRVGHLKSFVI